MPEVVIHRINWLCIYGFVPMCTNYRNTTCTLLPGVGWEGGWSGELQGKWDCDG